MSHSLPIRFKKWIAVFVLLILLLITAVSTTKAAPASAYDGFYHTVRYGEYLSLIAQRYGVSAQAILNANPHITNPNLIYYGTLIFIPTGYYPAQIIIPPGCRYSHYVSYGENLIGIGRWYGVSPFTIAEANSIYNLNHIYAGQYLCIP
jgi:hypothetical protein